MYLSDQTTTTATPELAPLTRPHPALKSLWNIPHLLRFPDPLPPLPEIRKLIQNRIAELTAQLGEIEPTAPHYANRVCDHKSDIAILQNRLEELQKHFPTEFEVAEESPATAPETKNSTPEPGQNSQTPPPQQTQTRTEPGLNPDDPGNNPELPGIIPENPGPNPDNSGNSNPQSDIPNPQCDDPQSPPPALNTTDEELLDAAADLPLRVQGRSRFDKLTAQEQTAIIGLLEIHKVHVVLDLIAQPPPIGFSLKVGRSSLYEFRARYKKREADRTKQQIADRALAMIKASENPIEDFTYIYESMLQTKALIAACDPDAPLDQIEQFTNTIAKLRKQALAERKQDHTERIQKLKFALG